MLTPNKNKLVKILDGSSIITIHDFENFLGIKLEESNSRNYFFREEYFNSGIDWSGHGQGEIREKFEKEYDVHYPEETFIYLRYLGVVKVLNIMLVEKDIDIKTFRWTRDYIYRAFKEVSKEKQNIKNK